MIYREAGQFRTNYAADQAVFPIFQDRFFVWAIALFAFFAVPFLASEYLLRAILVPFLILAVAAIGLNLLVGYCGQISLGSAAFMAVGAYAAYDITVHLPFLNLLLVFVLGGLCAAAAEVLFGHPPCASKATIWPSRHWRRSSFSIGCSSASPGSPITRLRARFRRHRCASSGCRSTARPAVTCFASGC
jgi:hypothetical protein